MKRFVMVIMGLVCASAALAQMSERAIRRVTDRIPDQYIVVLNDEVADVDSVADDLAQKHQGRKERVFRTALKGFSIRIPEAAAAALAADPRVKYVEEDARVQASATQSGATWGLDRVDQRDLPLSTTYNYDRTGTGVKVYILDSGILGTHADLTGRVAAGYDAIGGGTTDCNGHGTHVAGTAGGTTWGVAKKVTLIPVRVLDCSGSGTISGVIAGIDWVTSNHGAGQPAVANMSLGGGASTSLNDAVTRSIGDGIVYAVAAGNDGGVDACTKSPASARDAITVAATTNSDARASYSNIGTCVDLFAPGSSITSAWYTSNTATSTISGTSMATPHVAGAAALYLEANPGATPSAVTQALTSNATPNKVTSAGSGSPNLLLHTLFGAAAPAPAPSPEPSPTTGDFSLSITPSSRSVTRAGGTVSYSVTITRTDFTGSVSFSLSGQPSGATATFSPNPSTGTSSTMTLNVPRNARRGQYTLTVTGTSGSLSRTATTTLSVTR